MSAREFSSKQSTNHLLMIEPAAFYKNPQTLNTNVYQHEETQPRDQIHKDALAQWRSLRDKLLEAGVIITTVRGYEHCPDMVFPNSISTHEGGVMYLYPMLVENRRAEHSTALVEMLAKSYPNIHDWRALAEEGLHLESTASICRDRVNGVGYSALSQRTSRELAQRWLDENHYEGVIFQTRSHKGPPVYHTDVTMWIGTSLAAICLEAVIEEDRARVKQSLMRHHEVLELSMEQLCAFAGNALEVRGHNDARFLVMSSAAYNALHNEQIKLIERHFNGGIIHTDLSTLERYGGGSARCCLMELF